ncbi:MAG: hypothetical protein BWY70_00163 [Bacteroidetes bacterium ADurb.Bin408]|nr:MAG: hypothetical protein BWY70_00163 [Bacteroidetes bacterium ADurb.Bin408]
MGHLKKIVVQILLCFVPFLLLADIIPERPYPPRLVNDFSGILSMEEVRRLEAELITFDDSTGVQITVVTVNDLGDYAPAEYADILGEKWGVGRKKLNNGVVILIKPTGGQNQRKAHIAVGYGLESVLPDAICKRIVENEMIPSFRENHYYEGLVKGIKIIGELALGEYPPEAYKKKTDKSPFLKFLPVLIFIIIFILLSSAGRSGGTTLGGGGRSAVFWTMMTMMNSGRSGSGGWGGSSSGGGFGGFGCGSFGGGGAGGSW